jgi:hypothetical protein
LTMSMAWATCMSIVVRSASLGGGINCQRRTDLEVDLPAVSLFRLRNKPVCAVPSPQFLRADGILFDGSREHGAGCRAETVRTTDDSAPSWATAKSRRRMRRWKNMQAPNTRASTRDRRCRYPPDSRPVSVSPRSRPGGGKPVEGDSLNDAALRYLGVGGEPDQASNGEGRGGHGAVLPGHR